MDSKNTLENLRERLNNTILEDTLELTDKGLVDLSQQLDKLIVFEQRKLIRR